MKKRLLAAAALAAAVGSIASGCGGGNDTTTASGAAGASGATGAQGAPLTKDAFLAKANALCKKGNQELNQAGKQFFQSLGLSKNERPSPDQIQQFATQTVIPKVQAQVDGVDALPAPSGDEAQVQAIVDAARQDLDKIKQDPSLLEGNNDPFADANKLAKQYGLDECAGG